MARSTDELNVRNIDIPDIVIRRLPMYARSLQTIIERGNDSVSSDELASASGISSAQIRRDLAYFGRFGTQGRGYNAPRLLAEINHILGLDQTWTVALCGYGNLGRAIALYGGFVPSSFRIAAIFDRNEERVGTEVGEVTVEPQASIAQICSSEGNSTRHHRGAVRCRSDDCQCAHRRRC